MESAARILVFSGLALVLLGGIVWALARTGLGRLPGDLSFSNGNVSVYVPIVSMLIASVLLTILLNVALRLFR
jgi:Protein of unknown function (DUF2905)